MILIIIMYASIIIIQGCVSAWIIELTKWIGNARGRPIQNIQVSGVAFEAIRLDRSGSVNIITALL